MNEWDRFATLIVAGERGAGQGAEAVEAAGGRLLAQVGWENAPGGLARAGARTVLLLEAQGVDRELLEAGLSVAGVTADALDCSLVIALDEGQIDLVTATLLGGNAQLLVDPSVAERVAALVVAAQRHDAERLSDVREGEAERLRILNEEVARIAAVLAQLSARTAENRNPTAGDVFDRRMTFAVAPEVTDRVSPAVVRQVIRLRRLRDATFRPGIFEDPAWDILLDLFAAELEGSQVSVSSLCIAAAVAPTTALRWIGKMTDWGLLRRRPDQFDRRRAYMSLSGDASTSMASYFSAVAKTGLGAA